MLKYIYLPASMQLLCGRTPARAAPGHKRGAKEWGTAGGLGALPDRARRGAARRRCLTLPSDAPVRLRKSRKTSNLFRSRDAAHSALDADGFTGVISVDTANRTADVLAMTTYEDLVEATLPYGLMPLVVPQLKTITLGGAVTGLGIECRRSATAARTSRCSRWMC